MASADQISQFRQWNRLAIAQASGGDYYAAQASVEQANALFIAMDSPPAYKDELDYSTAAVYGGSSSAPAAGQPGAVADAIANELLTRRAVVNSRPDSVSRSFFSGFSQSVDDALSSLGSAAPFVKWGSIGLGALFLFRLWK